MAGKLEEFVLRTQQQMDFLTVTKLDEMTHWNSMRMIMTKLQSTISDGLQKINGLKSVVKDMSVRVASTEILASTLRRELDENTTALYDSAQKIQMHQND